MDREKNEQGNITTTENGGKLAPKQYRKKKAKIFRTHKKT
jgi:hypothetical protein